MTDWKDTARELRAKDIGIREISRRLNQPYTTVWDALNAPVEVEQPLHIQRVQTRLRVQGPKIMYIPDNQVRPGVSLEYLRCVGEYIALKKPDVIVSAGDFADMESLSSYDKGKKSAEGKRVSEDIKAAIDGMQTLLAPVIREQQLHPDWKPRMVLTLGNHEERIKRHVEANPELAGFLSYESLRYKEFGWEVFDFLEPVTIGGVTFIHYYPNPMTGKPYGGSAASILQKVGCSVIQGHRQCLDSSTRMLHNGVQQWSIVAGACYDFDESYKGYTGNKHWRGVVMLHNVKDGGFDPLFVSLSYLMDRFAK